MPISTDTLAGRCAMYLLDNATTVRTEHGWNVVVEVTESTLSELIDFVERERVRR